MMALAFILADEVSLVRNIFTEHVFRLGFECL
jgi:hypothetical protein